MLHQRTLPKTTALLGPLSLVGLALALVLCTAIQERTGWVPQPSFALDFLDEQQQPETAEPSSGASPVAVAQADSHLPAVGLRQHQSIPVGPKAKHFKLVSSQRSKIKLPESWFPAWLLHFGAARLAFSAPSLQVLFCTWLV